MQQKSNTETLLAYAWRQAALHPRLQAYFDALGPRLGAGTHLLLRRFDAATGQLETLAAWGGDEAERRTSFNLGHWSGLQDELHSRPWQGARHELLTRWPGLLPATGPAWLTLAWVPMGETGAVLGLAENEASTDAATALQSLIEPCTAALTNELLWRELASGREAAEAARQALLLRLKRQDISDSVVGADAGLREVMEAVDRVARTATPVLILGETGTGKEVVARAVHMRSPRAAGPFLRVNCGAIPAELIDSELFGHERGSFTGATGVRRGWFERTDGGTLFLDEVGELSPAAQVRLLRVLQDGSFQRVGGERSFNVDVRVMAATNRDLHAAVAASAFREDLWFRLAVFPIALPPLRERLQDIPALAVHFSLRAAERLGLPPRMPDAADLAQLEAYPWPGNVRELASVIERAAILGDGRRLEVARALGVAVPAPPIVARPVEPAAEAPDASLEAAMRSYIETALSQCHGRVEGPFGAARRLQMNPHTLRSRMRRMGIDWQRFRGL